VTVRPYCRAHSRHPSTGRSEGTRLCAPCGTVTSSPVITAAPHPAGTRRPRCRCRRAVTDGLRGRRADRLGGGQLQRDRHQCRGRRPGRSGGGPDCSHRVRDSAASPYRSAPGTLTCAPRTPAPAAWPPAFSPTPRPARPNRTPTSSGPATPEALATDHHQRPQPCHGSVQPGRGPGGPSRADALATVRACQFPRSDLNRRLDRQIT
jgi:hypothetical protein